MHIFSLVCFGLSEYLHLYLVLNEFFFTFWEYFFSMPGECPLFWYNLSFKEWSTTIARFCELGFNIDVVSVGVFMVFLR